MLRAAVSLFVLSLTGCEGGATSTSLCDIARAPSKYIGRATTITDIVIVDGHGEPILIPNASCDALPWFSFTGGHAPTEFGELVSKLNATTIGGHRAGLAGHYTVEVVRRRDSGHIELNLIDAADLRIVDADSKSGAIDKQMGPPPTQSH
jgi:hypothetical protein